MTSHRRHGATADVIPFRAGTATSRQFYLPLLIIFAGFILRAVNITGESLWRDEVDTIRYAFAPLSEMVQNLTRNGFNGPLYLFAMRAWLSLTGINDLAVRYFSLICGALMVALIYVLSRRLFDRRTALLAMWFATIAPVLIWYSGEGKMYTFQPALLLLAIYSLRRAVDVGPRGRRASLEGDAQLSSRSSLLRTFNGWWIVFTIAVSVGYYVHLLTPLFLAVAAVLFAAWWPRARHHWRGALIALAICTVPYIPLAIWQIPTVLAGMNTGHIAYSLDAVLYTLVYNWSVGLSNQMPAGIPANVTWLAILCYTGAVSIAVVAGFWFAKPRSAGHRNGHAAQAAAGAASVMGSVLGMLAWLLLPALIIFLISLRAPVFEPRYVLWSAPALYILAAYGLSCLMPRLPLAGGMLAVLISLASLIGLAAQFEFPIRPDLRGAAQAVASQMQSDDLFVFQIPYTRYGFEYYLPQEVMNPSLESGPMPADGLRTLAGFRGRIVEAPFTNGAASVADVAAALQPLEARSPRIWLIESEAAMWDRRALVRAWFDQNMAVVWRGTLRGITVTLYGKP